MSTAFRKRTPPPGSYPGQMAAAERRPARHVRVIDYSPTFLRERVIENLDELAAYRDPKTVTWIEVEGLGDQALLERIGQIFEIHPLALADVVNVPQRPKAETYEKHELVILRMVLLTALGRIHQEQVSLVVGPSWVLLFQEHEEDCFELVRERIRSGAPIRSLGADFLAYALSDTLIDGYYPVLEHLGDELEEIEEEVVRSPNERTLARIHATRRELLTLHRTMRQQRDAVGALVRGESPFIGAGVKVYLRDAFDHAIQINDVLEGYRELAVGLMEVYLSSVSNRMNEVMKVLTAMGSIFLPLTFIVGVYGMNFDWMPELRIWWAYPALWAIMIAIGVVMYFYFRRRGWIGDPDRSEPRKRFFRRRKRS